MSSLAAFTPAQMIASREHRLAHRRASRGERLASRRPWQRHADGNEIAGTSPADNRHAPALCGASYIRNRQHAACNRLHDTGPEWRPIYCVSPITRSREAAVAFPAGNRPVPSSLGAAHEARAGGTGEHRRAERAEPSRAEPSRAEPSRAMHECAALQAAGTAPQLSPFSEFPAGNSAKCSAAYHSKQQ